jgi:hypothetical protein
MNRLGVALSYGYTPGQLLVQNSGTAAVTVNQTAPQTWDLYTARRFSTDDPNHNAALWFGGLTLEAPMMSSASSSSSTSGVERKETGVKQRGQWLEVKLQSNVVVETGVVNNTTGGVSAVKKFVTMGEVVPTNVALVGKEQLVDTVVFDTNFAQGQVLATYPVPLGLIFSGPMKNAFRAYELAHVEPSIRVQMNSNTFQCGSVVVVFAPLMNAEQATSVYANHLTSISVAQHMILYAGRNQSVEMKIPYVHPYKYLNMMNDSDWNSLGTLLIICWSPLRVGDEATSTSAALSLFAKFESVSFQVVNPTSVTVVPQGGVQSSVKNINLSGAIINGTVDAKSGADSFQGGSTQATLQDKPNWGVNPFPVMQRTLPNLTNNKNVDFCEVLDADPGMMMPVTSQTTVVADDEMNFGYLCSKYSYHSTFQLSSTNVLGEAIFVGNLCPCDEFITAPQGTTLSVSLLSFISLPFSFWRGSLRFKLVAVCSPMHSARLQVCSHVGFKSEGLDINAAFGQYVCIFDISGGVNELIVEFPWRSQTDWKKVINGSYPDIHNYTMGQFSVRVLNPLQAPEVVASTVDIMVFVAGGEDFRLGYLGNNSGDCYVEVT